MSRAWRWLHLRQVRRQPLRAALAVLAIASGVTLTVAVLEARASLNGSFRSFNSALGGPATLRVASRYDHGGIDASVLGAVDHVDGVQAAVPFVAAVTQVYDSHGEDHLAAALGVDCRAQALFGPIGCDPNAIANGRDTDPPIIGPSMRTLLGSGGILRSDVGDTPMRDAVVLPQLEQINHGIVAVYPLPVAQRLFARPNGLDAIYIVPKPGVPNATLESRLAAVIGPQNRVLAADDPGVALTYLTGQLLPFMLLISLFGLTVGGQLVYNTMALSLEERRRELAVESALGGTPRIVVGGVLAEAAVLGVAGAVAGLAFGLIAARPFVDSISHYAEQSAGIHLVPRTDTMSIVAAFAIALIASVAAALVPARRASRLEIASELADRSRHSSVATRVRPRRAVILSVSCVIGLLAAWRGSRDGSLEAWQPAALTFGVVVAWVCAFALGPALAPFVMGPLARLRIVQRGPERVAFVNVANETRRTTTLLTAIAAAVGISVTLGSVLPGMSDSAKSFADHIGSGRVMVTTLSPNNTSAIDSKVAPDVEAKLVALPGVAAVEHQRWAAMDFPGVGLTGIQSTDGAPPTFTVYHGVDGAQAYARGEVMVGPALARSLDLRPGTSFTIAGHSGPMTLVVGGIWAAPDSQGKSISAPPALFEQLVGTRPTAWLFARPAPGVSPEQLAAVIRAANLTSNLRVWTPEDVSTEFAHDIQGFLTPFWLLARGMLIVAFIATSSTLLLAAVKRRAEHGLLAAVGMGPGDLGRMVLIEAGIIGVMGTLCGLVGGLVGLAGFSMGSATLTGLNIPFHVNFWPVLVYGSLATACAVVGAALPAWRTAHLDPVIALRYE